MTETDASALLQQLEQFIRDEAASAHKFRDIPDFSKARLDRAVAAIQFARYYLAPTLAPTLASDPRISMMYALCGELFKAEVSA